VFHVLKEREREGGVGGKMQCQGSFVKGACILGQRHMLELEQGFQEENLGMNVKG
jgi:hypothetical protein